MPILGVVTCQILELEFAHLISTDPQVAQIRVIEDEFSGELIRALEKDRSRPVHRVTPAGELDTGEIDGLAVLIRVMKVGLHANIPILTREVTAAVREIAPFVGCVLLGYGLCGNALKNAELLFADIPVPVILPLENGHPVDDCVGLIIGGRENYYAEQCRCAGTMFMNAGFSRHWKEILSFDIPQHLLPKKDKLIKRMMANYQRSLLLPTAVLGEDQLMENTLEFNQTHGLRVETRPGSLALLERAWQAAKRAAGL
jgi:Protein of unknown function (DUF1638)